ncbi:MAG: ERCC4 domain-containing protein [Gemmatimonadota bacterium]
MTTTWVLERTASEAFPFRISIEQGDQLVVAVRAKARWPGPGQQIFCLRERELDPAEPLQLIERVPVAAMAKIGRKLTVTLDRGSRKRCEFLAVAKPRSDGQGSYEQIFFRTESGIRSHRSRSRVELRANPDTMTVIVDSAERYPWTFPGATIERRKLAVGDYALEREERIVAVVERKSFDNLLGDVGAIQALHHQLADLASHEAAALVIEADYRDFLDPARLRGRWPAAHLARVLAELHALHPRLPMVYAGNRKTANAWTQHFFLALASGEDAAASQLSLAIAERLDQFPRPAGIDDQIRHQVLRELPDGFGLADVTSRLPEVPVARVKRVLGQLQRDGKLFKSGRGAGARWRRALASESS